MKKAAVFCPIRNENTFIDLWLDYYSQHFDADDIKVIDFGSDEEYLKRFEGRCQVIRVDNNIFDAWDLYWTIIRTHENLSKEYEYVLPTDVDEIVYHKEGLRNFIDNLTEDFVTCQGYELIHIKDRESDYDSSKPLFEQRSFWYREPSKLYDKTLITNKTLIWTIGLHRHLIKWNRPEKYDVNESIDPGLYLIHLHRHDYTACINRHLKWSQNPWSQKTIEQGRNKHYQNQSEEDVINWYESPIKGGAKIEEIPEEIKNNIGI